MRHLRNILWGILGGLIYGLLASLLWIRYEHLCLATTDTNGVLVWSDDREGLSCAEQPLREDAVGLYSETQFGTAHYIGKASWYGEAFAGRTTACGSVFDPAGLTCASLRHRCGSRLSVCLEDSERCVDVTVTDKGPYIEDRVLDLSGAAFAEIADLSRGVVMVEITEKQ